MNNIAWYHFILFAIIAIVNGSIGVALAFFHTNRNRLPTIWRWYFIKGKYTVVCRVIEIWFYPVKFIFYTSCFLLVVGCALLAKALKIPKDEITPLKESIKDYFNCLRLWGWRRKSYIQR